MFGDVAFAQAPFAALGSKGVLASISASAAGSDDFFSTTQYGGLVEENASGLSYSSVVAALLASQAELGISSEIQTSTTNVAGVISEGVFASFNFASVSAVLAAISQSASIADTPVVYVDFRPVISEAATVFDSEFVGQTTYNAAISESANVSSTQTANAVVLANILEQASGVVAFTNSLSALVAISEVAAGNAAMTSAASVFAAISDSAAGLDTQIGIKGLSAAIVEAVQGSDSVTRQGQYIGVLSESATAQDLLTVVRDANVAVTGVQLYVRIGDTLVWAVIDDSQNPNWQLIDVTQIPGWTRVPS